MSDLRNAPIGVFDSGLGGLTVALRLRESLPQESLLYVADQAHVPYGGRDLAEVRRFAQGVSAALFAAGCKAVVMACNISSATALSVVRERFAPRPVFGVIAPGAREAICRTRNKRIGVLATAGTVKSEAYSRALLQADPELRVLEIPCPAFVPLVESGATETPEAVAAARDYLAPLLAFDADTVILGCTHYPFLLRTLRALAPSLVFADPAERCVLELAARLDREDLLAPESPHSPAIRLSTTGDSEAFATQLRRILPEIAQSAELLAASWRSDSLQLQIP